MREQGNPRLDNKPNPKLHKDHVHSTAIGTSKSQMRDSQNGPRQNVWHFRTNTHGKRLSQMRARAGLRLKGVG